MYLCIMDARPVALHPRAHALGTIDSFSDVWDELGDNSIGVYLKQLETSGAIAVVESLTDIRAAVLPPHLLRIHWKGPESVLVEHQSFLTAARLQHLIPLILKHLLAAASPEMDMGRHAWLQDLAIDDGLLDQFSLACMVGLEDGLEALDVRHGLEQLLESAQVPQIILQEITLSIVGVVHNGCTFRKRGEDVRC